MEASLLSQFPPAIQYDVPLLTYSLVPSDGMSTGWVMSISNSVSGVDPLQSSTVAVEVSMNGQDWSTQGVTFTYTPIAIVTRISPTHGPRKGGTEVIVYGTNFVKSSLLACQFGDSADMVTSAVRYMNGSQIICITPPSFYESKIVVRVTNNGNELFH